MRTIDLDRLDKNLRADIAGEKYEYEAFEADDDNATVSNQCYHIVFAKDLNRGGVVFVGSGSSGQTSWTDATSPDDVLRRFLGDEMIN